MLQKVGKSYIKERLKDDTNGTITGTPLALLDNPLYQIRALLRKWDGTNWIDYNFDHTKFSDTHSEFLTGRWSIKTAGATQGRTFLRDLLGRLCQDTMTRLVPYISDLDYSLGLFCHGTKRTVSALISDENASLLALS